MQDTIVKQRQFKYPIAKVWKAIALGEEISTWFIKADFKPEVGYRYTFVHEQTKITGEVLTANPVYELIYTWIVSGTEVVTTVSWTLEENESGTLLTLEHSGISNYPEATAVTMLENFQQGWAHCIENMDKYLFEQLNVETE